MRKTVIWAFSGARHLSLVLDPKWCSIIFGNRNDLFIILKRLSRNDYSFRATIHKLLVFITLLSSSAAFGFHVICGLEVLFVFRLVAGILNVDLKYVNSVIKQ